MITAYDTEFKVSGDAYKSLTREEKLYVIGIKNLTCDDTMLDMQLMATLTRGGHPREQSRYAELIQSKGE